jgi:hypothetical protein
MGGQRRCDPTHERDGVDVLDVLLGAGAAVAGLARGLSRPLGAAADMAHAGGVRLLRRQ